MGPNIEPCGIPQGTPQTFISWRDIEYGVPQGSILGPLLFNIHLCDIFYFQDNRDIASNADDNTLYTVKENKESILKALEASSQKLFKWFKNNIMKVNSDKSHLFLSCNEPSLLVIDGSSIETNTKEVFRGITIDKDLEFDDHVNSLCKKACQKLDVLARLVPSMDVGKKKDNHENIHRVSIWILSLVWMFHSRGINNKINRIHERALRITYNNNSSSFQDLLDNSVTIHHRNIRTLAIETFKVLHGFSPSFK